MFCPDCGAEYVEGVFLCSDCGTPLVPALPEAGVPGFVEFVEIPGVYDAGAMAVVKSLLAGEGIEHFFKDESVYAGKIPLQARLMVRADQADAAREILADRRNGEVVDISGIPREKTSER